MKGDASPGGLSPAEVPEASADLLHQEKVVERRRKKAFLALSRARGHVGITPGLGKAENSAPGGAAGKQRSASGSWRWSLGGLLL